MDDLPHKLTFQNGNTAVIQCLNSTKALQISKLLHARSLSE